ncbi:TBC1 domain family member 25 [Carcharodon carcharias]|uniref:TBC1 domain family member 25 n=1 Tax=Carcharodon carcharias TaxID=13397 RepID=UPI001B7F6FAB|nr:TBC1 domain family member 25 [Carcharodon carcharias]
MAAAAEDWEVVRVRVQKCEGSLQPEFRSFAVDPQITSFEVLQHILIRAFDLSGKKNFVISYLSPEKPSQEVYLSLQSDWDLDVAFSSLSKAQLQLKVDIKPSEDSPLLEDWDIISPKDVIGSDLLTPEKRSFAASTHPLTQSIISQVGRTISKVQQVLSWSSSEEAVKPFKPPLSDAEFHTYLNHEGQLCRPEELRLRIYHGGVEPALRKVVWRYLLNVYPDGLTGQERMDYIKRKTREYERLKGEWAERASPDDLEFVSGMVLKDVLRTDRTHPYYAGSEDSPHLMALHDLLITYALTHPRVSYCQGMSDIASPILAVMDHEGQAYICFCGIMKRLEANFQMDGEVMAVKFRHLKLLLQRTDPEFYAYLLARGADELFFCYRWLLLELKREFAFEDALRLLEVAWSSLPPDPPETEVELTGAPLAPADTGEGGASRHRHMVRPARELASAAEGTAEGRWRGGEGQSPRPPAKQSSFGDFQSHRSGREEEEEAEPLLQPPCLRSLGVKKSASAPTLNPSADGRSPSPDGEAEAGGGGPPPARRGPPSAPAPLPPPQEFGRGNPFALFLCLAVLLEHRDHIVRSQMDYNELAMHFDRLVRRQNLNRVLHRAKALFADYLQSEVWDSEAGDEAAAESPASS